MPAFRGVLGGGAPPMGGGAARWRLLPALLLSSVIAGCSAIGGGGSPTAVAPGSSSPPAPSSESPFAGSPPPGLLSPGSPPPVGACLSTAAATAVWNDVTRRVSAVQLDPAHAGLSAVATGIAAARLQQYIDRQLVAQHLTEHEVDRLDGLTVVTGRCGPTTLTIDVRQTLVVDDYLGPGGRIDHPDPNVGMHFHQRDSFVEVGTTWKLSDQIDLDTPPQAIPPQVV